MMALPGVYAAGSVLEERMESPDGRSPSRSPTTNRKKSLVMPPDAGDLSALVENELVCIECGRTFRDVTSLQMHLKLKTAWSCTSLLGCRICALVDNLEWHEGTVRSFHRSSGKHLVEFEGRGEARWMRMSKTALYVIRPSKIKEAQETKEVDGIESGPRSFEHYDYVEDISEDFCLAQSRLYHIYGRRVQETGHKTSGHVCITMNDKEQANAAYSCLLYGELLPRGVNKALSPARLHAKTRTTLIDLGMGTGKICIQAFLQYPNLTFVYGVELAESRYEIAVNAARSLCKLFPTSYEITTDERTRIVVTSMDGKARKLEFELGSMFDTPHVATADIVLLETDVLTSCHEETCNMLRKMPPISMLLSYLDLEMMWDSDDYPFVQHRENRDLTDRYPTSWSVSRGHHFYLWMRVPDGRNFPNIRGTTWGPPAQSSSSPQVETAGNCCLPFLRCFRTAQTIEANHASDDPAAMEKTPASDVVVAEAEPEGPVSVSTDSDSGGPGSSRGSHGDRPPTPAMASSADAALGAGHTAGKAEVASANEEGISRRRSFSVSDDAEDVDGDANGRRPKSAAQNVANGSPTSYRSHGSPRTDHTSTTHVVLVQQRPSPDARASRSRE
uniref:C2H2-type domain-containing protein n=1 Tax=Phaeomonas parva TaxID=124430 RepID=A0A6U4GL22_9STRA|mmetsp:Transcript_31459/g.99765  ORF Transcript_31459/g.99765 Transcript_31459/m.99765 type:complete len:617 (+) Transcript_31459:626-2476(+)